jgi:hypothetical protein
MFIKSCFNFAKVVMIYDFDLMIYYFLYRMTVLFELLPAIHLCLSFKEKQEGYRCYQG